MQSFSTYRTGISVCRKVSPTDESESAIEKITNIIKGNYCFTMFRPLSHNCTTVFRYHIFCILFWLSSRSILWSAVFSVCRLFSLRTWELWTAAAHCSLHFIFSTVNQSESACSRIIRFDCRNDTLAFYVKANRTFGTIAPYSRMKTAEWTCPMQCFLKVIFSLF